MERRRTILVELQKGIAIPRNWDNILGEHILQKFCVGFLGWQHVFGIFTYALLEDFFLCKCWFSFIFLVVMYDILYDHKTHNEKGVFLLHGISSSVSGMRPKRNNVYLHTRVLGTSSPSPEIPGEDPHQAKILHCP